MLLRRLGLPLAALLCAASVRAAAPDAAPVSAAERIAGSPDIAVAADGSVYALWVDKGPRGAPAVAGPPGQHPANYDIVVARSTDGGRSFGAPVRANSTAGEVWAFPTSRPRLAVSGPGTVHVFYTGNAMSPANGKPVLAPLYARSTDGGRGFSPARPLAPVPPGDLSAFMHGGYAEAQTFGTLIASGRRVQALWIDTRAMQAETDSGALYTAISTDDGASFASDAAVYADRVCPCCQLTAAAGAGERLYLGSREATADGFRDSTVARSDDGGRTFGPRVRLGSDRWSINGCPLKPTVVAADGRHVYAAGFSGATDPGGVRFAASADHGERFGSFTAVHPEAAVSDAPSLVALGRGRLALAWHGKLPAPAGGPPAVRQVFLRLGRAHGARWDAVTPLSNGEREAGYPVLAAGQRGQLIALWVEGDRIWRALVPAG